jgi:hypothetical protein
MMNRSLSILILLISLLLLTGCQTTYMVRNTAVKDIIPVFKDYVGMYGYVLTYQNDKTGSYSIYLGDIYVPSTAAGKNSKTLVAQLPKPDANQPLTAYEESTWVNVSSEAHYQKATAAVSISQKGSDVMIFIDTNDNGNYSLNDISNYLKNLGFTVDNG